MLPTQTPRFRSIALFVLAVLMIFAIPLAAQYSYDAPINTFEKVTVTKALTVSSGATVSLPDGAASGDATFESITGSDSSLGITGVAGAAGAGGAVPIAGGAGDGTGNGGAASLTGGASGEGATGNGGAASLAGGAAASTNGTGGAASVTGGVATGTGTGGAVTITSGASAGASGTAGAVNIDTGSAAGGTAGAISIGATNASVVTITSAVVRPAAASTLTADAGLNKADLQGSGFWGVDTSSAAVDVDLAEDAAMDAADIGSRKTFAVTTGHATQALTVSAGASGITTVTTLNTLGTTCEDTGDFIECLVTTTGTATCVTYCAD